MRFSYSPIKRPYMQYFTNFQHLLTQSSRRGSFLITATSMKGMLSSIWSSLFTLPASSVQSSLMSDSSRSGSACTAKSLSCGSSLMKTTETKIINIMQLKIHHTYKHSNTCHGLNFHHNFFFLNAHNNVLYQNQ